MKKETGGSAFPCNAGTYENGIASLQTIKQGMTMRDWFAGMIAQGLVIRMSDQTLHNNIGSNAYSLADAMLKARGE